MRKIYDILKGLLQLKATEFVIFTFFVLFNASFLLEYSYIHSLDGAQHIYNSMVIAELATGNNFMSQFFSINPVIVGYWTGPFLLSLFNYFFAANVAMKLLIFVCLAGVAYSFRYLIYSIRKETNYLILLIIPFTMQTYLLMGYYTFSVAWIFFFIGLGYYIRHRDNLRGWSLFWMGLLFLLLYLSHLVVFAFALVCLFIYIIFHFVESLIKHNKKEAQKQVFNALKLIGVSVPSLVLTVIYAAHVFKINGEMANTDLPTGTLLVNLVTLRNLIAFDLIFESPIGRIIFFSLVTVLVYLLVLYVVKILQRKKYPEVSYTGNQFVWFIIALSILAIYFFMPNTFGTGAISVRILVWFYFMFAIWFCLQKIHWPVGLLLLFVLYFTSVERSKIISRNLEFLNSDVKEIVSVGKLMEPNSIYYTLNYSEYWSHIHFGCYAGADVAAAYVLNPQCEGHFPVIWNKKDLPCILLGNKSKYDLNRHWVTSDSLHQIQIIDYVVVWGHSMFKRDKSPNRYFIEKYYSLIGLSEKGNAAIYKFKFKEILNESFKKMRNTPSWYAQLQEKAKLMGIPVENVMVYDAFYLLDLYYHDSMKKE